MIPIVTSRDGVLALGVVRISVGRQLSIRIWDSRAIHGTCRRRSSWRIRRLIDSRLRPTLLRRNRCDWRAVRSHGTTARLITWGAWLRGVLELLLAAYGSDEDRLN